MAKVWRFVYVPPRLWVLRCQAFLVVLVVRLIHLIHCPGKREGAWRPTSSSAANTSWRVAFGLNPVAFLVPKSSPKLHLIKLFLALIKVKIAYN